MSRKLLSAALLLALSLWAGWGGPLRAGSPYVTLTGTRGSFPLAAAGRVAPLVADPGDHAGVLRVLRILAADLRAVTGTTPAVVTGSTAPQGSMVIVGTVGRSRLVDRLVRDGKLDVRAIAGKRETFLIQPLGRPLPGVERALVIAGSDKRGTIYGMLDLSAEIGVSPWHWWADVTPEPRTSLYVLPGLHTRGEPKVRYRGIFINDEAPALAGWVKEKFGDFNARFYERVFELILRMKGNFLWPAMWGHAFYDDDTASAALADEVGVVIGTSHHEPMTRAHDEWRRYGSGLP